VGPRRSEVAVGGEETTGQQLDAVARSHLWAHGWECRHGIGHGVGSYLHVHEGPQRFSKTNDVALELGMVSSCEPGVYLEGAFGVRLENTIATVPSSTTAFGPFYAFETLTLCPFDRNLIETEMLTAEEHTWLDTYHRTVRQALKAHLGPDEVRWLEGRTRPLLPRTDSGSEAPCIVSMMRIPYGASTRPSRRHCARVTGYARVAHGSARNS